MSAYAVLPTILGILALVFGGIMLILRYKEGSWKAVWKLMMENV